MSKQRHTFFIAVIFFSMLNIISVNAFASNNQEDSEPAHCAINAQIIPRPPVQKQLIFFEYLDLQNGNDGKFAKNLDTSTSEEEALAKYLSIYKVDDALKNICNLSDVEIIALMNYTDGGFSALNFFLRLETFEAFLDFVKQKASPVVLDSDAVKRLHQQFDSQISYKEILDSALDHLEIYKGEVFRGTILSDSIRDHLRTGEIYSDPAFMSTSISPGVAGQFGVGPNKVLFVINSSQNGHKIWNFSGRKEEQEILFKSQSKFKITKTEKIQDGGLKVWMTEVSP